MSAHIEPANQAKKRIEYIDALRGFTIFLVVLNHVALTCLNVDLSLPSFHKFFFQVRMPMFFLISGFVLYKNDVVWNTTQIVYFFKKKIPVQLISPLIFFMVYMFVTKIDFIDGIFNDAKYGYWFTFVLFIYFVINALVRYCFRGRLADYVLLFIGVCLLPANWPPLLDYLPVPKDIICFFSFPHWHFFFYFVLGNLLKKYYNQVQVLLDGRWLLPLCIFFYFIVNGFKSAIPVNKLVLGTLLSISGLVILFSFFYKNQRVFSKVTRLGKVMQYVGRRTLDIYLIHYFLLPVNLTFVTVFKDHPMPILEFVASSIIAIIIIAACLLVSNIIRLSPFLAHWLFGAKRVSN